MGRDKLPFRQIARCLLLTNDGQLLAKPAMGNSGEFCVFPGGGADPGESLEAAAAREVLEETGAVVDGKLTKFVSVKWVWNKGFADSPTRKTRYAQFQGEEITLFLGRVKSVGKPTSAEGDAWKGSKKMSIKKALDIESALNVPGNPGATLAVAKVCALRHLQLLRTNSSVA
jgi:ADP-ribose pyrophosphatase YjhB (NUDIX family)